ncbi:hypothetical protein BJ875DRAFT_508678 [Amylocarpus encephaloides]|uniref:Uncharacterized protein n=1 Tax=Amylocarpus encephaloides TaxID=45428 RepID=A0A9P7Y6I5_9HELO|nr:hypothetical protein BJ875DRAFT_508678 [Amylocarpus encephaloides]
MSSELKSLKHVHNKVVNIYSHLLGAVLFITLLTYVFIAFFFGLTLCFSLLASFYIILNHSEEVTSTIPSVYYGFSYNPAYILATLTRKFRHPTLRPYRTTIYTLLGLSMSLTYLLITGMLNVLGAVVYIARIPESSHQIFHFLVVFTGLTHMFRLLSAFDFVHSQVNLCA